MKQHFTSREDFEAYIIRTGQDDDTQPDVYMGYGTTDFREAWDITETYYLTEKAYMFIRYDEYRRLMNSSDTFDNTFEFFLDCYCNYEDYYHSVYIDWIRQKLSPQYGDRIYSWNETQKIIQLGGTLITAEDYMRSKT